MLVLAVTVAVIISILLTVMCVEEVNKLKKKKKKKQRLSGQSTQSIEQETRAVTIDPQPASVMPPSTYIDINLVDVKKLISERSKSPMPSPSVSVRSNSSIQSEVTQQPTSNNITNNFSSK